MGNGEAISRRKKKVSFAEICKKTTKVKRFLLLGLEPGIASTTAFTADTTTPYAVSNLMTVPQHALSTCRT